ncbi:MAG: hypothetical protein IKK57_08620 [Clostridia bacterium]|nr:hypothetical protein [Clostridia bacterium]
MTQLFQGLLGLPEEEAVARARAAGVEPVVCRSCAPRRDPAAGTLRVIRVQQEEGKSLRLTVSAFLDGDPAK